MPASRAACEERVIVTLAIFDLEDRECDWPLATAKNEVTMGEILSGFAPLVHPVGSSAGSWEWGWLDVFESCDCQAEV